MPINVTSLTCTTPAQINADFEDGSIGDGWFDESRQDLIQWKVLNKTSWSMDVDHLINNAQVPEAPSPNYLQLIRKWQGAFAVAELRSTSFISSPGDRFEFSFWIQSKFPQFNNLQVHYKFIIYQLFILSFR